ncbi:hypothetical protein Y032_0073g759 [Ancylostoma ceylanicum]|uniref:Uncharacterized protein n=1 Tax=Ancylostoma ceylanicum TaxID=53326 RepID=A0A016TWZ3_9BILA|nr:hypothetical protein Y032_0073g759 [Ancylostoma ceylanicum]
MPGASRHLFSSECSSKRKKTESETESCQSKQQMRRDSRSRGIIFHASEEQRQGGSFADLLPLDIEELDYSKTEIILVLLSIVVSIATGIFWTCYFCYCRRQYIPDEKNLARVSKKGTKSTINESELQEVSAPALLPLDIPGMPVKPKGEKINMAEYHHGGRLVMKDMKGAVKHALQSEHSEHLGKIEFDIDQNEIVDIGTGIDIIQMEPSTKSCEYSQHPNNKIVQDKPHLSLSSSPTKSKTLTSSQMKSSNSKSKASAPAKVKSIAPTPFKHKPKKKAGRK